MNLKKTEYCAECKRDVYLNWNAEKDGYWCYCPYCGKKLILGHYCHAIRAMVDYTSDNRKKDDDWNYKYKNYFLGREQAEKACSRINEVIQNEQN